MISICLPSMGSATFYVLRILWHWIGHLRVLNKALLLSSIRNCFGKVGLWLHVDWFDLETQWNRMRVSMTKLIYLLMGLTFFRLEPILIQNCVIAKLKKWTSILTELCMSTSEISQCHNVIVFSSLCTALFWPESNHVGQDMLSTYPFRHLPTMWVVVVELQHEDRDDHRQAYDHHGAREVLS